MVVGYGSIGARHASVLKSLDCDVAVVTRRGDVDSYRTYSDLDAAIAMHAPRYVVIANETAKHRDTIEAVAATGLDATVLVEKPLFASVAEVPRNRFAGAFVAYNLRYHPLFDLLSGVLESELPVAVHAYVGQYLPSWRPSGDYRKSYSSLRSLGGGVLRDLSHELDYVTWLFGEWRNATALGGHFSNLEIETDDVYSILLKTRRCPHVTIHMNYVDRVPKRILTVITNAHTYAADFRNGTFSVDGACQPVAVEPQTTYVRQHSALLSGDTSRACSFDDGLMIVDLIEQLECSSGAHWTHR